MGMESEVVAAERWGGDELAIYVRVGFVGEGGQRPRAADAQSAELLVKRLLPLRRLGAGLAGAPKSVGNAVSKRCHHSSGCSPLVHYRAPGATGSGKEWDREGRGAVGSPMGIWGLSGDEGRFQCGQLVNQVRTPGPVCARRGPSRGGTIRKRIFPHRQPGSGSSDHPCFPLQQSSTHLTSPSPPRDPCRCTLRMQGTIQIHPAGR